jgi:RimJ/RimL family protein N-acetyltransferase
MDVYLLWHSHPTGANERNEKLIGVYSSEDEARSAQNRVAGKPGFADCPDGFEVVKYSLGEDHWTEGYFTE